MNFHYNSCGLENIYLVNGFKKIDTGYGPATSIENLDGLHEVIGRSICALNRRLGPKEISYLRREMELRQVDIAEILGCTDQTIANWEKGKSCIPKSPDAVLRHIYLESLGENPEMSGLIKSIADLSRQIQDLQFHMNVDHAWHAAA
jgi:DNA-binding transcriptional regulator YiaG